jgi:hypothetical protein
MGAGGQAGLNDLAAVLGERADHVADHAGAVEQLSQRPDVVRHLDDLVVDRVDAGNCLQGLGDARLVPARRDERDPELAQVLADQPPGVAGGAVDDDLLVAHATPSLTCPCRRRPAVPRR